MITRRRTQKLLDRQIALLVVTRLLPTILQIRYAAYGTPMIFFVIKKGSVIMSITFLLRFYIFELQYDFYYNVVFTCNGSF